MLPMDAALPKRLKSLLDDIQDNLLARAKALQEQQTQYADTYAEFKEKIAGGGFVLAHWDGTTETEERIQHETKATLRLIPLEGSSTPGHCMCTGKPSSERVFFCACVLSAWRVAKKASAYKGSHQYAIYIEVGSELGCIFRLHISSIGDSTSLALFSAKWLVMHF